MSRAWSDVDTSGDYGDGPEWEPDDPDPAETAPGFRTARERDLLVTAAEQAGSADDAWADRLYLADVASELDEGEWE